MSQLRTTQPGQTGQPITRVGLGALLTVAAHTGSTPRAIAAAWTVRNRAVHGAILGFGRPDQVDAVLDAGGLVLTDTDVADIQDLNRARLSA